MKKALHRIKYIILALLLILTILPTTAFALSYGECGDGVKWVLNSGTLTISGKGAMTNYTDATKAPWYDIRDTISRVIIGEGVTTVGRLAFYECTGITAVSLPSTVTDIGSRAFKNCSSLTSLSLPSSLKTIGDAAFEGCETLDGVRLPSSLETLGDYVFYRCYALSSITIPASVISMGMVDFAYCSGLARATILCPITKIPDWTFYDCTSLYAISLPETVTEVGELTFWNCDNLDVIYCTEETKQALTESIKNGEDTGITEDRLLAAEFPGTTTIANESDIDITASTFDSTSKTVTETENATITVTDKNSYTVTVDGEETSLEEAVEYIGDNATENSPKVEFTNEVTSTITATVDNSDGWTDLSSVVTETISNQSSNSQSSTGQSTIPVQVQIPETTVSGSELSSLAGKDVELTVVTSAGDQWKIDESTMSSDSFSDKTYDLGVTVTEADSSKVKIESDTVYKVEFADNTDFNATVSVNVGTENAGSYATLYQKTGILKSKYEEVQTVMVDYDGNAWFSLAGVKKSTDYYVGIDVEGVDTSSVTIPESMYEEYGLTADTATYLTDSGGTQYEITGRTSKWGITGGQFALYAVIIIAVIVLIVTLTMVTINKINRSKLRYSVSEEDAKNEDEIDEDALRLEVLKELLDEQKANNNRKQ